MSYIYLYPNMDNERIWSLMAKRLAGEASPYELRELETMLRTDPDLHYSLEALQDLWNRKTIQEPEKAETALQKHLDRMQALGMYIDSPETNSPEEVFPETPSRFITWKAVAISVSGFLFLTLAFHFLVPRNITHSIQKPVWEVATRNGTKTNLLLPDGSTVWLNADSRLTYDSLYGNSMREVTLSGEAYFDVVKNPKKPFIIHTGKINIKVLGTTFNVKSYPGERTIETSLIRGSIEVTFTALPSKKIVLKANEKLIVNKSETIPNIGANQVTTSPLPGTTIQNLSRTGSDSALTETGWMQNRLYFNDMPLPELLRGMERKYGVSFHLPGLSPDTIHFTGSFQNETVSQALDALRLTAEKSTAGFSYELQGNQVFIYHNTTDVHSIPKK